MKRGNSILNRLFANSVHSIRCLAADDSEAKAFYRFFQNDKVRESDIIRNMSSNCGSCISGKVVLCIQDSSEINLYRHRNRLHKDGHIGVINASATGLGVFIHPSFVEDADSMIPYGFADVKVWNRGHELPVKDKSHAKNLAPVSEKESYKWIESSLKAKEALSKAASVIIVQDREADIYEQFCLVPDECTHLLIRAKTNRVLADKTRLFQHLSDQPKSGQYQIMLEGDKRRAIEKRTATIEVRFSKISIISNQYNDKSLPTSKDLYAIEAKEVTEGVKNPIVWRLLTTLNVADFQTALLCIEWYSCRWMIEEVFRILKKEGFNIEASELAYGKGVRKLCPLMLETIITLFLMQIAYTMSEEEVAPQSCFSEQELEYMEHQMCQLEGRSEKLKKPYKPSDLKRYIWVFARLGGWKGYASGRKPGITTFWHGLQKLTAIVQGWLLFKNMFFV